MQYVCLLELPSLCPTDLGMLYLHFIQYFLFCFVSGFGWFGIVLRQEFSVISPATRVNFTMLPRGDVGPLPCVLQPTRERSALLFLCPWGQLFIVAQARGGGQITRVPQAESDKVSSVQPSDIKGARQLPRPRMSAWSLMLMLVFHIL